MTMLSDLAVIPVEFEEEPHKYWYKGKELRGITDIISKYVMPERAVFIEKMMSTKITRKRLDEATRRGSNIHDQVEMIVNGFGYAHPAKEVEMFFNKMADTRFIAAEYLVSDLSNFASKIDIIDSELNLYDIKTTSKLDTEYLSWQLSIYAYLFELNNPKLKVGWLYGVWLRDKTCRVVKIERKPDEIIADLLYSAAAGLPWSNPYRKVDLMTIKDVASVLKLEKKIEQVCAMKDKLEEEEKEIKEKVRELMLGFGIDKWTSPNGRLTFTLKAPYTRNSFDSTNFKNDYPDLYQKYLKESNVKASVTIKISNDENNS